MTAILLNIYCYLMGFVYTLNDWALRSFDSVLGVGDYMVSGLDYSFLTSPDFASISSYTWLLGATGVDVCIGIVASALILRFALQSIPFVRWGS